MTTFLLFAGAAESATEDVTSFLHVKLRGDVVKDASPCLYLA
jgi:hypothetical protein